MRQRKNLSRGGMTLREEIKQKMGVATLYVVLRILVILVMVAQFLNGNFENVFLCILTLILFLVPTFIERKIRIDLPDTLEVIILLFIFAAEILGEIQAYYITFPQRVPLRRHRLRPGGYPQPKRTILHLAVPAVPGPGGVLLLHDHRRVVGIL